MRRIDTTRRAKVGENGSTERKARWVRAHRQDQESGGGSLSRCRLLLRHPQPRYQRRCSLGTLQYFVNLTNRFL
ncbi:hypothetical protein LINPERHAP1_LOCUS33829 [Linum perenne]